MRQSFPIDHYTFYRHDNRVIAVSSFAGKIVRGVAVCADGDEFDMEYGKRLAAARCNYKVALKRRERATDKVFHAMEDFERADKALNKYRQYFDDANNAIITASNELNQIMREKAEI